MRRTCPWGACLAAVALLVVMLSLAGCGSSSPPDEFAGTWREPDYKAAYSPAIVIAKSQDGYRATMVYAEAQPEFQLTRSGDKLVGTMELGAGTVRVEIVYEPQSGHVTFANETSPGGPMAEPVERLRVSTSTVIVTPSPY